VKDGLSCFDPDVDGIVTRMIIANNNISKAQIWAETYNGQPSTQRQWIHH